MLLPSPFSSVTTIPTAPGTPWPWRSARWVISPGPCLHQLPARSPGWSPTERGARALTDEHLRKSAAADPEEVARALAGRQPGAEAPAHVETRETHISWVFLAGDRAYKLKKPLVLDFVDYGTAERRREMCLEELRLNARLAPDVYLGVRALVPRAEGGLAVSHDAADPSAVDFLVEMQRYAEDQTMAAAAARGEVDPRDLVEVGSLVARFHRDCPVRLQRRGAARALAEIDRNLSELTREPGGAELLGRVAALARFLRAFITGRAVPLDARGASGLVREVHGDLRAEHVILRPRLSIVDCLEFDSDLRTLDVADDLAFLAMDLTALGADRWVPALLEGYEAAGGNFGDEGLLWFYAAHRALVRVKVALVRAGQEGAGGSARCGAPGALTRIAERLSWRARGPLVLTVCGPPASGKSQLAAALAAAYGLPVLSSDLVRKELAGGSPQDRAPDSAYSDEFTDRTYRELADRARRALGGARTVVVDATFRREADRSTWRRRLAGEAAVVFVECVAPVAVLAERARRREQDPHRVSDATAAVAERLRSAWQPLGEITPDLHLAVRTDRPVRNILGDLLALLDERLAVGPMLPGTR